MSEQRESNGLEENFPVIESLATCTSVISLQNIAPLLSSQKMCVKLT